MKNLKKRIKNMSKKCFSLMLVALMVIIQFPVTAFAAETVTEEDIDDIIRDGIVASNEAMAKGGSYAVLSDLDENNTVTVNMYDDDYKIKTAGGSDVYTDIITVLVQKLFANKEKVEKIEAVAKKTDAGIIELDKLTGQDTDNTTIVNFILQLGLTGKGGVPLDAAGGIGQLDGQSFQVKVTAKDSTVEPTYTVHFKSVKVTDTVIDEIIKDGIKASNAAMSKGGNPYAELSDLEVSENGDRNVTVKMYNPDYAIKGFDGEDVYKDIIQVLIDKLYQNRERVTKIQADISKDPKGTINLSELKGTSADTGKITGFITELGLKGNGENGALQLTEGIGQLDGQSFSVTVTANDNTTTAKYTVTFKTWKELELTQDAESEKDSNLKLEVTDDSKTLIGNDLVDTTKASGSTVSAVKSKFEKAAGKYTIKVVDKKNNELDDTASVGTGSKIELRDERDQVVDEVVIVVMGDVDGDGRIDVSDATNMLNNVSKISKLSGVYEEASHVTGDPVLSVADVVKVLNTITNAKNK